MRIKRSTSNPGARLQRLVLVQKQPALYNAIKRPDSDNEQNGEADEHPDQRYTDHMTQQRQPEGADLPSEMRFIGRAGDVIAFQIVDDDRDQHRQSTGQPVRGVKRVQNESK